MEHSSKLAWLLLLTFAISCKHELSGPTQTSTPLRDNCSADTVYFQQQILPIIISNCGTDGCHDPKTAESDIVTISYETLTEKRKMVKAGDAEGSWVYALTITEDTAEVMPPPPWEPLPKRQTELIKDWVNQGGLKNSCNIACDTIANPTFSGVISLILEDACIGCHNSIEDGGGIDYSTFSGIKETIDDGSFWGSIMHEPGYATMPKYMKLADCHIQLLKLWLDAGAKNN